MALETFKLESLSTMDDGRVRVTFEQALRRIYADCRDRPGVAKPRTLSLKLRLTPTIDEEGDLDTVQVVCDVDDALPRRRTKTYEMKATKGGLFYNELSPEAVDQKTLDEAGLRPVPTGDDEEKPADAGGEEVSHVA